MVWIRLSISCIAFLSVTGSIAFGIIKLAKRFKRIENPILLLSLQKLALLFYWIPISFVCVCIPRISFENGVISYCGEFVCSTVPNMTIVFYVLGGIWFAGFFLSAALAVVKRYQLYALEKGNVPIEETRYLAVFEECRKRLGMEHIFLYQNDRISSPITVGLFRKRILLPFAAYTDTELCMLYEHELTHIINKDLLWRIAGLATSWIHWFNPAIYQQLNELDCQQEMVCDLYITTDNARFTKKEYAAFLARLTDCEVFHTYTIAFAKNQNQTIRRIEKMRKTMKLDKPKKAIIGLCCVCLAALTLIPATMLSAKTAQLQESWIRLGEVSVELALQGGDYSDASLEEHGTADGRVREIESSLAMMPHSASIHLEKTIDADTRHLYGYRSMSDGDLVSILATCDDSAIAYRIGIKNKETGVLSYILGTGTLIHQFQITESGTYAVYVENCSQTSMNVWGTAAFVSGGTNHHTDTANVSMIADKTGESVSQCSFALTGEEERGEGIVPQGIVLGKENQLNLMLEAPLGEEKQKKMSVQIFLDYHQIPFIVDGKEYDTYYIESQEDISIRKQITLATEIDRGVDHKITALCLNDLQSGAGELLYIVGNGIEMDTFLFCDEKKDKLSRPETAYETEYKEYEEISGGIFLTLEEGENKRRIPNDTIHAKPGETVKVYYHLAGARQTNEALVFLNIGEKQEKVNGKDFLLFQRVEKDKVLYGELEITAPMEPGKYDVSAWAIYNPYGETEDSMHIIDGSPRFTLSVEK